MTREAKEQSNGKFLAYVNGQPLRSKKGVCRNFKSERAALRAAYTAQLGTRQQMTDYYTTEFSKLKAGDEIVTLIQTCGDSADGEELIYSAGSHGEIIEIDACGVHVSIGEADRTIMNTFTVEDFKTGDPIRRLP